MYLYLIGFWQRWGFQPQQILETTATQTQGKERATQYTTVIPPALALIYLAPFHNLLCTHPPTSSHSLSIGSSTSLPEPCQVQIDHTSHPLSYFIHLPMKMELLQGSETSDISIVTQGNYPKENILHTEHGESLKSTRSIFVYIS